MIEFIITVALILGGLTGLALILPCEACRLRRERMKQAYATWQATRTSK